jgi:hypothetical protein
MLPMSSAHETLTQELTRRFSAFLEVEAVGVGGSLASGSADTHSDIDLYVFCHSVLPLSARQAITAEMKVTHANLNLTLWDIGDEWYDSATGIEVDVIYWSPDWIEAQLNRLWVQQQPSMGYSTCFWTTMRNLRILFDRCGWLEKILVQTRQPYPEALRLAILEKNHSVLRHTIPSYTHQIEKVARRGDLVSLNHRVAALLASYFDVLFALNRVLHPGEKRLLNWAQSLCPLQPEHMAGEVEAVLRAAADTQTLPQRVHTLIDSLDELMLKEGFDPHTSKPLFHDPIIP